MAMAFFVVGQQRLESLRRVLDRKGDANFDLSVSDGPKHHIVFSNSTKNRAML
jgi:hypothetical protein